MQPFEPLRFAQCCALSPDQVHCFDTLDSTNRYAKELAQNGAETALVTAYRQTDGRGRMGHTFFSPSGSGIYFTLLMRCPNAPEETVFLTTAAAVLTARAIEAVGPKPIGIKWVNDLYLYDRKIAGILCESGFAGSTAAYCCVGIGINLTPPEGGFPPPIRLRAGALFREEPDESIPYRLVSNIVKALLAYQGPADRPSLLAEYRRRLFLLGERVSFVQDGQTQTGIARDLDEQARLIVDCDDEQTRLLSAGEVHLTRGEHVSHTTEFLHTATHHPARHKSDT